MTLFSFLPTYQDLIAPTIYLTDPTIFRTDRKSLFNDNIMLFIVRYIFNIKHKIY